MEGPGQGSKALGGVSAARSLSPWSPPVCLAPSPISSRWMRMRKPGHPEGELPAQALAGTTLDHPLPHQLPAFKTSHPGQLRSLGGGGKGLTLLGRDGTEAWTCPWSPGLCCGEETLTSASVPGSPRVPGAQGRGCTGFQNLRVTWVPGCGPTSSTPPPQVTAPQPDRQRREASWVPPGTWAASAQTTAWTGIKHKRRF